tara:strand:- start:10 stop:411 length:402 start_codon:yes stop_codon:yes gene_type:complete
MKKIETKGNLPRILQVFLKEMGGETPAEIYECESARELMNWVKDKKAEETSMMLDPTTNRGYVAAFGYKESQLADLNGSPILTLLIYFAEVDEVEYKKYDALLKKHRKDQQKAMYERKEKKNQKPRQGLTYRK